ncbi:hypothetical protein GIS00_07275 [Nakamurella sp. YIM 132087]|uniref:Uncharacterized protein n=1 Tax=Nakamurella alba TaxID=2665158 RepID=A0A7K1FKH1_9ACTN|nr:NAD(P)-dependent oxidoreductase [Nakamurella alba]MTD13743.1 hypothetical protein [Nakamurella alba]
MSVEVPAGVALAGERVVVFGGGAGSAVFAAACAAAGARVHLVSPWACNELQDLVRGRLVTWSRRNHHGGDVAGACLVFAGSAERRVNVAVELEADRRRIRCVRDDTGLPVDGGLLPAQRRSGA